MKLPQEFLNRMEYLLGESEFKDFLVSLDGPRSYGLRVNTLKLSIKDFLNLTEFTLEPVPWSDDGFYYVPEDDPGKHPHYYAGLYYIQEPSAMLPATILGARPGDRVLDLCAAPGGKTIKIAADMKGEGLIIANDISESRAKALVKNIELFGVKNAIVTVEKPEKLSEHFRDYFDKILVDAPCSGEGMFRKDEDAVRSWESYKSEKCSIMQRDILNCAAKMLKPGGSIVYSTCTFSPDENERRMIEFLDEHHDYSLCNIHHLPGLDRGRPQWCGGRTEITKTVRLWPHMVRGEGHYVALLKRNGIAETDSMGERTCSPGFKGAEKFLQFVRENLNSMIEGHFIRKGDNLYCLPVEIPDLTGIRVAKFGWYLGAFKDENFEPSHSLAMALKAEDFQCLINFGSKDYEVLKYLKGETLMVGGPKGLCAVCVDGFPLGWGKQMGSMLKNLYPKGWRKLR